LANQAIDGLLGRHQSAANIITGKT
jgi:hypothetical protein